MNLLAELKRRNVIRMAGLYLVAAWLVVQVAGTLLPMFDAPAWIARAIVVALAIGFVPALVFAWIFELTPAGLRRDADVTPEDSITPRTARRMDRAIIVVLLAALGYFAFDKFVSAPHREAVIAPPATVVEAPANAPPAAVQVKSVAVLPLSIEGGDRDEQYFSDGLADNLITALSQFPGLKVISRNSAFQFRDTHEDSAAIGRKLGVAHLLEGSVRRLGDSVRIHATLVLAADGSTVWSQRYDRAYTDLFRLQDEIAAAVASALKAKLLEPAAAAVQDDRPPSGDLAAYNAYLQGAFEANTASPEAYARAMAFFRVAIQRDPRYAQAWAALANAKALNAALFLHGDATRAGVVEAREAIDRALALAPDSAFARAVDAGVMMNGEFRYADAERAAQRSVELAPTAYGYYTIGLARFAFGDVDEADHLFRQALELDPLSAQTWFWLSINLAGQGRLDEARAAIERNLELRPGNAPGTAQRVLVQVLAGQSTDAYAAALAMPAGNWRDIAVAMAAQHGADAAEAERTLAALIASAADGSAYQIAEVYAHRGEPAQVFAWLERAWAQRDPGLRRLRGDPFIARYRDDPRFAAISRTIGVLGPGSAAPAAQP
ncbi:MAG: tetratricopeptide repeat protein [Xanthomonadales bacterium]|nr:tetratricopeptide repeat protein [Xanthomonadales bacterium]